MVSESDFCSLSDGVEELLLRVFCRRAVCSEDSLFLEKSLERSCIIWFVSASSGNKSIFAAACVKLLSKLFKQPGENPDIVISLITSPAA